MKVKTRNEDSHPEGFRRTEWHLVSEAGLPTRPTMRGCAGGSLRTERRRALSSGPHFPFAHLLLQPCHIRRRKPPRDAIRQGCATVPADWIGDTQPTPHRRDPLHLNREPGHDSGRYGCPERIVLPLSSRHQIESRRVPLSSEARRTTPCDGGKKPPVFWSDGSTPDDKPWNPFPRRTALAMPMYPNRSLEQISAGLPAGQKESVEKILLPWW